MNPRKLTLALVLALTTHFAQAEAVHAPPAKAKSTARHSHKTADMPVSEPADDAHGGAKVTPAADVAPATRGAGGPVYVSTQGVTHADARPVDAERLDQASQIRGVIQTLLNDNDQFVKGRDVEYFKPFMDGQHPRATVVTCSDSRVHTHAFDQKPDGDLFMVRNIGNQLSTAEGSVEYGVHHLHTPVLVFVGHSVCGAIKAASGDFSKESAPIQKELHTIRIPKGIDVLTGIRINVNNQVAAALKKFKNEVEEGKLTVVGAVYDFHNDLKLGYGRLIITNLNGETNPSKIGASSLIRDKEAVTVHQAPTVASNH